jgi:hypothetical protein
LRGAAPHPCGRRPFPFCRYLAAPVTQGSRTSDRSFKRPSSWRNGSATPRVHERLHSRGAENFSTIRCRSVGDMIPSPHPSLGSYFRSRSNVRASRLARASRAGGRCAQSTLSASAARRSQVANQGAPIRMVRGSRIWPAAGAQGEPAGVVQAASANGCISLAMALPFSISATRNSYAA